MDAYERWCAFLRHGGWAASNGRHALPACVTISTARHNLQHPAAGRSATAVDPPVGTVPHPSAVMTVYVLPGAVGLGHKRGSGHRSAGGLASCIPQYVLCLVLAVNVQPQR